ncbi:MAG: lysylphosphatidylglycerol synthase transmembrane domain-containing protein, partial [Acidimicrobiales bacterium]
PPGPAGSPPGPSGSPPGPSGSPPRRRRGLQPRHRTLVKKSVKRAAAGFVLALVIEYLVLPQVAGTNDALRLIGSINLGYAFLGIALEAAAVVCYAALTRVVLPSGSPSLFTLLRIDLSGLAVSHVLPGGTAGGTGVTYRLLTEAGVRGTDAGFGLATQGIGSAVVLNVLLWLALLFSIPLQGFKPLYGTAAIVGVLLLGAFAALVLLLTKGEEHAARVLTVVAARLPYVKEESVTRVVRRLAERLRELGRDPRLLARAVGWAAANWLFDAASLWVFLLAFHHATSPDSLLVAYGLANVLAAIPITPGGLGVVEGVLTPLLVGFGMGRGIAILGVISYRLVNFWLPIPVGALAYVSLRVPGASRWRKAQELEALAEQAEDSARRRAWVGPLVRRRRRSSGDQVPTPTGSVSRQGGDLSRTHR